MSCACDINKVLMTAQENVADAGAKAKMKIWLVFNDTMFWMQLLKISSFEIYFNRCCCKSISEIKDTT